MEMFTFPEPLFDETYEIFLAKENNVVSEQTFRVLIQNIDFPPPNADFAIAEFGVDYGEISRIFSTMFPQNLQRIPVSFAVFADTILEQTEAFQIIASYDYSRSTPGLTTPNVLFLQSYVILEDDDGTFKLI